jgi:hypothetical protein
MRNRILTVVVGTLGILVLSAGSALAAGNPPGNNGTVKVDALPFDDAPNNEPHVNCLFQIDFAGYDQGNLTATATFELIPPTGNVELVTDSVAIGGDPAGGANDNDGSITRNLSALIAATGVSPQPNQGFHIRVTVHADGSIGSDVKHKTFWYTPCVCGCGGWGVD